MDGGDLSARREGAVLTPAPLARHIVTGANPGINRYYGSAYQEPEFLDAVRPAIALVSVGAGNDYGHPNPALLDRLARTGARILRTDMAGDIAAVRSGDGLAVAVRGADRGG